MKHFTSWLQLGRPNMEKPAVVRPVDRRSRAAGRASVGVARSLPDGNHGENKKTPSVHLRENRP